MPLVNSKNRIVKNTFEGYLFNSSIGAGNFTLAKKATKKAELNCPAFFLL